MQSSVLRSFPAGKRRGVIWLDICVILVLLGIMGGLAWTGWERSQKQKRGSDRAAPPSSQKTAREVDPQPAGGGG